MKIISGRIVFLFLLLCINYCTTHQFQSPYADQTIKLEGWEKKCNGEREYAQWYLFWGGYAINKIDEKTFFPSKNKSYKLFQRTTWLDGTISALGGSTISVTRKTWVIEDCNLDPTSDNDQNK
ncbi:hypothetical protein AB3N62_05245 [Leptospira sp. WS4.C2]